MTAPAPEAAPATGVVDPAVTAAPATPPPPAQPEGETIEQQLARWKKQSRENEERAKANAKAAEELQKIKDGQKTEAEKAAEKAAQVERELAEARAEAVRYRVAATHHVSQENFDLLGTGDEKEIAARAERVGKLEAAAAELATLKAAQGAAATAANTPGPVPALAPGASVAPDTSYPAGWFPGLRTQDTTNS